MRHNKICDQATMGRLINKWWWDLKVEMLPCHSSLEAFMNHKTPPLHMLTSQPSSVDQILSLMGY